MNILASYNWIKDYLEDTDEVKSFVKKMTASGMSVEHTFDLSKRFDGMVVGVIKEVLPHPNADKLKIVKTDVGDRVVSIVCGGVNLESNQLVAVALPGSRVRWHGEEEWTELSVAKVRGEESYGMIVAPEEIGFDKLPGHDERGPLIWDITHLTTSPVGTPLVTALDLEDVVFDIEVTTNRPDAMSIIGLAREAGAAQAGRFRSKPVTPGRNGGSSPDVSAIAVKFSEFTVENFGGDRSADRGLPLFERESVDRDLELHVSVKDHELCPRYQAIVMDGVKVGPSPWWLQKRLLLAGHRPINNIVDITNYVLHEYGQPLHTFDYDTLEGHEIIVRRAKAGEAIEALDGNTYELTADHLVIADAKRPVAVAGVMGGEPTGTTFATTRIVFECATFEPVNIRRTARSLNLYSDSQQLFEKGLSTEALPAALARAIELVRDIAGGWVASDIVDVREEAYEPLVFDFDPSDVNARMGIEVPVHEQERIMESLGFELERHGEIYKARVPYWRDHDIESSVDFTEEVARVYGYERISSTLPSSSAEPLSRDPLLVWQDRAKELLAAAGCTEVYNYSFASEADLTNWGYAPKDALAFANPLSVDQKYLRVSLVPSVLSNIEANQGLRSSALLFELANTYVPREGDLPIEEPHLVIAGYGDCGLLQVKGVFERLMREMGILGWELAREGFNEHWHPGRSAVVKLGDETLGFLGELAPSARERFGLDARVALASLNMAHVIPHASVHKSFIPPPEFPSAIRDVAFTVDRKTEYGAIREKLVTHVELLEEAEVFDVYEGEGVEVGKKSMALHLSLRAPDRTLSTEEIEKELSTVRHVLEANFGAIMRS